MGCRMSAHTLTDSRLTAVSTKRDLIQELRQQVLKARLQIIHDFSRFHLPYCACSITYLNIYIYEVNIQLTLHGATKYVPVYQDSQVARQVFNSVVTLSWGLG